MASARAVVAGVACLVAVACGGDEPERASTIDCGDGAGRTVEHEVDGLDRPAERVQVHLPPCYDRTDGAYPTVWLLHGAGARSEMWFGPPVDAPPVIDRLVLDGTIEPVVVIAPDGTAGRIGFVEHEFEIVLADVEATFRVLRDPTTRAIAGVSAGGPTAASVAAESQAAEFAALGLFMTVWEDSLRERIPAGLATRELVPAVLVDVGEDDSFNRHNDDIAAALSEAGIEADVQVHPGRHDFAFMADRFPDWIRWLAEQVT